MRRIVLLAVVGLGLGLIGRAKADIPPPLPPAKDSVTVKIEVDEKAKGPRLVLPNGVFTPPRVRPVPPPKSTPPNGDPKSSLDPANGDEVAADDSTQPRQHLLIAGVALAFSLTFAGLWLVRKKGTGSMRGLALLIAAGATLTAGAIVYGNAAPPPFKDRPANKIESYPSAYDGKASVQFIYGQEPVRLILDKESYEKLKKGELTPVK